MIFLWDSANWNSVTSVIPISIERCVISGEVFLIGGFAFRGKPCRYRDSRSDGVLSVEAVRTSQGRRKLSYPSRCRLRCCRSLLCCQVCSLQGSLERLQFSRCSGVRRKLRLCCAHLWNSPLKPQSTSGSGGYCWQELTAMEKYFL